MLLQFLQLEKFKAFMLDHHFLITGKWQISLAGQRCRPCGCDNFGLRFLIAWLKYKCKGILKTPIFLDDYHFYINVNDEDHFYSEKSHYSIKYLRISSTLHKGL